jgi:YD repeat-containing protein
MGTLNGTITRVSGGTPLAGATIQAVLIGIIRSTATTAANGTYSIPNLDMGTYDVRVHASGYSSEVRSGTVVPPNATTVVNVAMSQPGSVTGKVTQPDGTTPIVGAAVTLFAGGIQKGSASTNGSGDYAVSGLHPGLYTLQAAYVGYRTKEQSTTVPENASTTANVSLGVMPAGPVRYVYDELGRLVTVIDAAGDAATYTYDPVGNILSIGRIAAGTVAITEFTPNGSPVGATVTVYGTGFSATPAQNTLTFNGSAATITSSTTTQIVTTVPVGATTGPIAVTTPLGSASSGTAFTVQAATGIPSISGFSPTLAAGGTALTINGANFDSVKANNRVILHQTFAALGTHTSVMLSTEVPYATTSGRITVSTPNGTATSTGDLFIPPPGSVPADVAFTGRLGFGDAGSVVASITPANKIGLLLFDVIPNQRVSLNLTQSTFAGVMKIYRPSGAQASSTSFTTTAQFLEATSFAEPGTHMIVLDPNGTATGTIRVSVYDVVDVTGTITPTAAGTAVPITIATPGQMASLTFSGAAGQKVSALYTTAPAGTLSIRKPDGTALVSVTTGTAGFIDAIALPTAGTYSLRFDPSGSNVGSIAVTFYDVVDTTTSVTPTQAGASVAVSATTPGQRALATFTAAAGLRVSLQVSSVTIGTGAGCRAALSILDPGGATIVSNNCVGSAGAFLNVTPALAAGLHTIVVDPAGAFTGGATVTAYNVPADWTGSITPGSPGSPVTVPITGVGQNGILSFNGTSGQTLSLTITGNTTSAIGSCTAVTIRKPDGSTQASIACVNTTTAFLDVTTLSVTGAYTILVDPAAERTGSITLALHSVVDNTGSIAAGTPLTVSLTVPGQNSVRSFSGMSGQRFSLTITDNTTSGIGTCTAVTIRKPDGSTQSTNACVNTASAFIEPAALTVTGTYTILVNPTAAGTGSITLTLNDVPADVTGTLTINAAATPVTLNAAGQNASFTFSGTLNQSVTVRITSNLFTTSPCVTVRLFRQDGTTQLKTSTFCSTVFDLAPQTLPATETYIVRVDPGAAVTGSLGLRVTNP